MYNINDFENMEPMRYYNNETEGNQKRIDMIENKDSLYIASEKKDGNWSMLINYGQDKKLIRSRTISKKTGTYGNHTDHVPHIAAEMNGWPANTVVLAELCWDEPNTDANTVGTILRCLAPKAVERQKEHKLKAVMFDILMLDGKDLTQLGYAERVKFLDTLRTEHIYPTTFFFDNFAENADRVISNGGEGIVIQRKDNIYDPGSRTAWKTLKLKQQLPEMELKVVGVLEPTVEYNGDCPENWQYKKEIDGKEVLVTKPYFFGWKSGITVELPNGSLCDVSSGLTDMDKEWLSTKAATEMIKNGELYAVVKAMSYNSQNSLRHPILIRLRNDM